MLLQYSDEELLQIYEYAGNLIDKGIYKKSVDAKAEELFYRWLDKSVKMKSLDLQDNWKGKLYLILKSKVRDVEASNKKFLDNYAPLDTYDIEELILSYTSLLEQYILCGFNCKEVSDIFDTDLQTVRKIRQDLRVSLTERVRER